MTELTGYEEYEEFQRMKIWESALLATLHQYEMLAGTRKIPLMKSLIQDSQIFGHPYKNYCIILFDESTNYYVMSYDCKRHEHRKYSVLEKPGILTLCPVSRNRIDPIHKSRHKSQLFCNESGLLKRINDAVVAGQKLKSSLDDVKLSIKNALVQEAACCANIAGFSENKCGNAPVQGNSRITPVTKVVDAAKEAMQIDNILAKVFQYAQVQDLKNFRLVSLQWKDYASMELNSRKSSVRIRLVFSEIDQKFAVGSKNSYFFLDDLLNAFTKSKTFPCSFFTIGSAINTTSILKLYKFFVDHGTNIKTLHFSLVSSANALAMILKYTPNIEYLKIDVLAFEYSSTELRLFQPFPPNFTCDFKYKTHVALSELKKIKIVYIHMPKYSADESYCYKETHNNQNVFRALLMASPNLLVIKTFDEELLPIVLAIQKGYLVKNIRFSPSTKNINVFQQFTIQRPKLRRLQIFNPYFIVEKSLHAEVANMLRDLLSSSQNTLKKLVLQPIGLLENFRMEPLPNVESLCFEVLENPFQSFPTTCANMFFSSGSDFTSIVFPKLKTVRFGMNLKGQYAVHYFPWDNPDSELLERIPTVDYVEIGQKLDVYALRFITAKFPKITRLKLEHTRYSSRMDCHTLWKFLPESLQHLELYEDALNPDYDGNCQQFLLDSVFTGFSEKICRVLRQFRQEIHSQFLSKRQKAAICDLRGLKTLRFTFASPQSYTNRVWFSAVSGQYAFGLMPQLQVIIAYDMFYPTAGDLANGLQLIAPFVRFEHRKIKEHDKY